MYQRALEEMRSVEILPHFTEMAAGSALIQSGKTRVLCTASVQEGVPPFLKGTGRGWLTAEYAMLPGATPSRKARDGVKKDGRNVEIGRLIGRSLRAACDLTRLGERTIYIDCDVLQADGGTRTAAITGGFVALVLAVEKLLREGVIQDSPVIRQVAAVSAGIVEQQCALDLEYAQDSRAQADVNIVMAREKGELGFVEVQGTGERRPFRRKELDTLLALAENGILQLMEKQLSALGDASELIGKKPKLALASNNFGKIKELRSLLKERFDVYSMREMGVEMEVEENGETFEENALLKAQALTQATGCAALADDSGLIVDALDGRPGVHSARYCGVHGDDEANNRLLLRELADTPAPRTARYACAIALTRPGRKPLVAYGACEGEILKDYRGEGGFGYDPLFLSRDLNLTFAEADEAAKNRVSHRARAIQALLEQLEEENG
ncbi:MAG TPA: ribonuclease PH [Candidatus Pullichristensenella excrementigallinarum]|uniref:Multifunctional fusion protein n=1 Tax=Candidatus Pullichristensenella excrementigallinarum TaxID=2840907 RepID=A0A9D1LAQ2_9FIRM|nr:ribonuclease PH [Candidatus Pullichristensenella excrementigallinarum]